MVLSERSTGNCALLMNNFLRLTAMLVIKHSRKTHKQVVRVNTKWFKESDHNINLKKVNCCNATSDLLDFSGIQYDVRFFCARHLQSRL